MTARSFLDSLPARNLRRTVKENKKLMIVICILQALGIPMCALMLMFQLWQEAQAELYGYDAYPYVDTAMYIFVGAACLGAAVIVGITAGTYVFQEMWKKTKVDMLYSLPLTGTQRFFSHYLAGAVVYLVPYVIAAILGWIIVAGGSFVIDFTVLEMDRGEFLAEAGKYYFLGTLGLFLLMALYYTSTVLITVCCGTQFESIYTTLLLNCMIPGTIAAVLAVICDNVSGLSFEYLWHPIAYTSPIGGLIYLIILLADGGLNSYYYDSYYYISGTQTFEHGMIAAYIRWALIIAVIIAACLVGAWQLYKRRHAESVGKPYVYIGAYHFMLTLLIVCILCLINADVVGPAILFSAIVYFVMEVIRKRGFRRFWLSAICYIGTVAITIGMFTLIVNTNAFGTVYRVPGTASVSSVAVNISNIYGSEMYLEYTDKEVIRAIREVHKDIAADMKEYGNTTQERDERIAEEDFRILEYGSQSYSMHDTYYTVDPETMTNEEKYEFYYNNYDGYSYYEYSDDILSYNYSLTRDLELTYYTYTGSTIHRSYEINSDQYIALMKILYGTELYARSAAEHLERNLFEELGYYSEQTQSGGITTERAQLEMQTACGSRQQVWIKGDGSIIEAIADCYEADLIRMGQEEINTGGVYGMLCYNIPIWNNCTETIAMLESLGMRAFNVPEKFGMPDLEYENFFEDHYADYDYNAQPLAVRIYKPGDYMGSSENYGTYTSSWTYVREDGFAYDDIYYFDQNTTMRERHPEMYELLAAAQGYCYLTEESYMLVVNGVWYAIPAEYNALADEIIALGNNYANESYWLGDYFDDYIDSSEW